MRGMALSDRLSKRLEPLVLRTSARVLSHLPPAIQRRALGSRLSRRYHDGVSALLEKSHSGEAGDRTPVGAEDTLPPALRVDLSDEVGAYWLRRLNQIRLDTYAGVRIMKFPEDLRVYEHLIWISRPTVVIEIGVHLGGSALWFRDRLRAAAAYGRIAEGRVIGIDRDTTTSRVALAATDPAYEQSITLIDGDIRDPGLPERVAVHVPAGARCLVVEDSAHAYNTTLKALEGFSRFVPDGGFFVVEDGHVDIEELRASPSWPRGVLPAIADWLKTDQGSRFEQRRDLELYGVSCHPFGFLERRASGP